MATRRKAVLISGASSGIGEATAKRLAEAGYLVFAGYRKEADAARLRSYGPEVLPLRLEITDEAAMTEGLAQVEQLLQEHQATLTAVVNNAGVAVPAFFELIPIELLRFQFEVNFIGPVRLIQLFLPLLRNSPSPRIVNVSSIVGRFAPPILGPYSSSKFAMEALSDTLRVELREWNIRVVTIEPGRIATSFSENAAAQVPSLPEGAELFEPYRRMAERIRGEAQKGQKGISPAVVAERIQRSIEDRSPAPRYRVGRDAKLLNLLRWILPDRLFDRLMIYARG